MRPGAFAPGRNQVHTPAFLWHDANCSRTMILATALEHDLQSCFQRAAAADAVRITLSTAHRRGDLAERAAGKAAAGLAKLWRVAQLKRIEAKLSRHFVIGREVLYERKV